MNPDLDPRTTFTDSWRAPSVPDGHIIVFDEPGRILGHTDFSSHYFRCTRGEASSLTLRVKHGAGEQSVDLGYAYRGVEQALAKLGSDDRYRLLYALYVAHRDSAEQTRRTTVREYQIAFAEGRLKKRKLRGRNDVKVWVEPPARRTT